MVFCYTEVMKKSDIFIRVTARLRPFFLQISVIFIVFMAVLASFVSLVDEVREGSTLSFDRTILEFINHHSSPFFDSFFVAITNFGGALVVAIITFGIFAWLVNRRMPYRAVFILVSVGGTSLINLLLKSLFQRARPNLWERLIHETSFSFPSGHAMASSALAACIIALLWGTKCRILAIISALSYMLLIGFSRLYLGVHYPTDILGGWLVSVLWVIIVGSLLYTKHYRRHHA